MAAVGRRSQLQNGCRSGRSHVHRLHWNPRQEAFSFVKFSLSPSHLSFTPVARLWFSWVSRSGSEFNYFFKRWVSRDSRLQSNRMQQNTSLPENSDQFLMIAKCTAVQTGMFLIVKKNIKVISNKAKIKICPWRRGPWGLRNCSMQVSVQE